MKYQGLSFFIFSLVMLTVPFSWAHTSGRFLGQQFMINMAAQNYDGSSDDSPRKLFEVMNVPIQDSFLGPGKALKAPERVLNFICANRVSGGYTCMIMIHRSSFANFNTRSASFTVTGEASQALAAQFFLDSQGHYSFRNEDNTLDVQISAERVTIRFDEQGL